MNVNATLVVGYRADELFTWRGVPERATRYDEITGVPYQKDVTRQALHFLGREIAADSPLTRGGPDEWAAAIGDSVESFGCGDVDENTVVIGIMVGQVGTRDRNGQGPVLELPDLAADVARLSARLKTIVQDFAARRFTDPREPIPAARPFLVFYASR